MKRAAFEPIDRELNEVHLLIHRLMVAPKGYKLTAKDLEELDAEEDRLNKARTALRFLLDDST
jgi:hypothetical protein